MPPGAELKEIAEYEKLATFDEAVRSGKHPRWRVVYEDGKPRVVSRFRDIVSRSVRQYFNPLLYLSEAD